MKKKICFLILLILSCFVFFKGWTQIKVSPDMIGVVNSKINGLNKTPVIPGIFSWNWEFLIPYNAKLQLFQIKPFNTEKTISGTISSGDAFSSADLLGYSFTFSLTLTYSPESIIELLAKNYISNEDDLQTYLNNASEYICQKAANYYISKSDKIYNLKPEYIKREELIKGINYYDDFSELDIVIISLKDYKLPNTTLYNKLLNESLIVPTISEKE